MVRRRMTYVKYLMYLEYITLSPSATRVITTEWANHALIRAIECPKCLGPMRLSPKEARCCGSAVDGNGCWMRVNIGAGNALNSAESDVLRLEGRPSAPQENLRSRFLMD
jgi:hypothetical protein